MLKDFISKQQFLDKLMYSKIDPESYVLICKLIDELETYSTEGMNKCGSCKHFERYNSTRGYCNKEKVYKNSFDFCSDWKVGI